MNKDQIIDHILESEGGYNPNEPAHVGGESYAGITPVAYLDLMKVADVPNLSSMKELEDKPELVRHFYDWYLRRTWELPEFLQYIHADFRTNAGSKAVKIIQELVGVDADGIWGSGTSEAIANWNVGKPEDVIEAYHAKKIEHYEGLAEKNPDLYGKYLAGWKRRANKVLGTALDSIEWDVQEEIKPLDDDDFVADSNPCQRIDQIDTPLAGATDQELIDEVFRRMGRA